MKPMILIPRRASLPSVRRRFPRSELAPMTLVLQQLHAAFRGKFETEPPRDWILFGEGEPDPATDTFELWARVSPPTKSRVIEIPDRGEVRTLPIAVTVDSRIPIVRRPDRYEEIPQRDIYFYWFRGWNAVTGMMVFDR